MADLKEEYRKERFYWGKEHCRHLEGIIQRLKKGKVLDIGAGEGRNSIFLAQKGFDVLAIDCLSEATRKIERHANEKEVFIKAKTVDIMNFDFPREHYHLVLAANVFNFFTFTNFLQIAEKIENSLKVKGFLYLSVFSTDDPFYKKLKKRGLEKTEKNTFYLPKKESYMHFFTRREIKSTFSKLKIISLEKNWIEDRTHAKLHYHDVLTLIATREK